jgi:hypothetical protein
MNIRKHASIRIRERCSLSVNEVQHKLNNDKYYPFGMDGKHQHKLIYSELDDQFFVVVQDEKNLDVITIMPLNWHGKWQLSPELLDMAMKHLGIKIRGCEKELDLPLKVGIIVNVKRVNYRILPYNGKRVPSTKARSFKIAELDEAALFGLGYKDRFFLKKDIQEAVEEGSEFAKNLKMYVEEMVEEKIEETEDDETVITFCVDVNGSAFKAPALGKIEKVKV